MKSRSFLPLRRCHAEVPMLEPLESRCMLNVAPIFQTPLTDGYWIDQTRVIGIDGYDADKDGLIISAQSDNPLLQVSATSGTSTIGASGATVIHETDQFAKLHFVMYDSSRKLLGTVGDVVVQLFQQGAPDAAQRFIDLATRAVKTTSAKLQYNAGGATNGILFKCLTPGADGNDISITFVSDATLADGTNVTLSATGNALTISYRDGVAKLQDVIAALTTANTSVQSVAQLHLSAAIVGSNVSLTAMDSTNLAGGSGTLVKGTPFYTNVLVHRIIPGFMIQMGDARNANGSGGSGLGVMDLSLNPDLGFNGEGVLGMANSGPNTDDNQFFITQFEGISSLFPYTQGNGVYSVFGQVISGFNVVSDIASVQTDAGTTQNPIYAPNQDMPVLQSVSVFNSNQDGTLLLKALDGFTGSAHVTITLDDGHGHTTQKVITVVPRAELGNKPTLPTITQQNILPGQAAQIDVHATDDHDAPIKYTVKSSDSKVSPTIDSTGHVSLNVPATYSGVFNVTVTAVEAPGFAEWTPAATTFTVHSLNSSQTWIDTGAHTTQGMLLQGNRLFQAWTNYDPATGITTTGLKIFDMTDPANPTEIGSYTSPSTSAFYRDVQVVGNTAFVAGDYSGVQVLDITDPQNITALQTLTVPNLAAVSVTLNNNRLYVPFLDWQGQYYGSVMVYDITNPGSIPAGNAVAAGPRGVKPIYPAEVDFHNSTMFLSDGSGAVFVYNAADVDHPSFVTYIVTGGTPWGMDVEGNNLYVADQSKGLLVYSITNPKTPKLLGTYMTTGLQALDVTVDNQTAFLRTPNEYDAILVTDPKHMVVESSYDVKATSSPVLDGTNLMMATTDGLTMMDVSDLLKSMVARNNTVTFYDSANHLITLSATNAQLTVSTSNIGGGDIMKIDVTPILASKAASVKISLSGGAHTLDAGGIDVHGSLTSLSAAGLDVDGDILVSGSVDTILLGDVLPGHTMTVSGTGKAMTMTLGNVSNLDVNSAKTAFKSVHVKSWTDSTPADGDIQTSYIGSLTSDGNFQADMTLGGAASARQLTLGTTKIGGDLSNALWNLTGNMGNLTVAKATQNVTVKTTGSMGSLAFSTIDQSDFLAGINTALPDSTTDRHATAADQFINPLASIKGIKITGIKASKTVVPPRYFYSDTNFSAATIGTTNLMNVQTTNGEFFGLWALQNLKNSELSSVMITDTIDKTAAFSFSSKNVKDWTRDHLEIESFPPN